MTLVDAGPLVALVNRNDPDHKLCLKCLKSLTSPMITTWPAFTEAMYLTHRDLGWPGQAKVWQLVIEGKLVLREIQAETVLNLPATMLKYRDVPMDLADASLVALADFEGLRRIFTLDKHFYAYRLRDGSVFDVQPML